MSDFDVSDVVPLPEDVRRRIDELDASIEERQATLTPEIKYPWQLHREQVDELDREREHWYRQHMVSSGRAAHFEQALKEICNVYPGTSVAGEIMLNIARKALL